MYTIRKTFYFSAAHRLDHLPEEHPCFRLHGHNYEVTIEFRSAFVLRDGFVIDYRVIGETFGRWLKETLDHRFLNDVLGSSTATTAENLAGLLYEKAALMFLTDGKPEDYVVTAIEVKETEGTSARFEP